MSTVIMSACWPLSMPPTAKAVLISLADQANDEGQCWPSVGTISKRTCLTDRAIQKSLKWLSEHGAIKLGQRDGRSTIYNLTPSGYQPPNVVHPRTSFTPEPDAPPPPNVVHPTPERRSPRTVKEPSSEPKTSKAKVATLALPDWVPVEAWQEWLKIRPKVKAPNTPYALRLALKALTDLKNDGQDPEAVLNQSALRGWRGLFPVKTNGTGTPDYSKLIASLPD